MDDEDEDLAGEEEGEEQVGVDVTGGRTLGAIIDYMLILRNEAAEHTAAAKKIVEELEALEKAVIERLDKDETTMSRGKTASAILTETPVPKVGNWDSFYEYIKEHDAFHLLQRRTSNPACRETMEAGEEIPGITIFTKRAISLKKI